MMWWLQIPCMQPPCCTAVKHHSEQIRGGSFEEMVMVATRCFSLLLVFSLRVEALSLYEYLVGVQKNNTAMLQSQCHNWKSANVDHTLRQEMASPRVSRLTAQSSKSMENRSEFFLAPSIISGFHLDTFTSDYPSHRVHPQYWQTRLRQYRVRPCNF